MVRLRPGIATGLLSLLFAGGTAASAAPSASPPAPAEAVAAQRAVIDRYCTGCHNDRLKTGGLSLGAIDLNDVPKSAQTWEKVVRKLRAGLMPPAGAARPSVRRRTRSPAGWRASSIARRRASAAGRPRHSIA